LFWSGWAASSVPGAALAYLVLMMLSRVLPDLFKGVETTRGPS